MKLLGVVVTYFPDVEKTRKNILSYIHEVDCLIIWENTPIAKRDRFKVILPEHAGKIRYMGENENVFIARALNQAVNYGLENGFSHILTMDQDSRFEPEHFDKYKQIACNPADSIAIFGPNPNYSFEAKITDIPMDKRQLITSGNIINLQLFDKIGLFREDFKIDGVDYEFCFRAKRNGYHCRMVSSILMKHHLSPMRNIPPDRLYYMARNNVLLRREYPEYGFGRFGFGNIIAYVIKPLLRIALTEKLKSKKIKMIIKGVYDGMKY